MNSSIEVLNVVFIVLGFGFGLIFGLIIGLIFGVIKIFKDIVMVEFTTAIFLLKYFYHEW